MSGGDSGAEAKKPGAGNGRDAHAGGKGASAVDRGARATRLVVMRDDASMNRARARGFVEDLKTDDATSRREPRQGDVSRGRIARESLEG